MIHELIDEIALPEDITDITSEISVPDIPDITIGDNAPEGKDIFSGKPSKQRVVFAISY